jgi:hypothetical protein
MTTPQNPGKRRRQKVRRTKQLTEWRAKQDGQPKKVAAKAGPNPKKTATAAI